MSNADWLDDWDDFNDDTYLLEDEYPEDHSWDDWDDWDDLDDWDDYDDDLDDETLDDYLDGEEIPY